MTVVLIAVVAVLAFAGGLLNTAAVGGSVISFLALLLAGLDPLAANTTNMVLIACAFAPVAVMRRRASDKALGAFVVEAAVYTGLGKLAGLLLLLAVSASVFAWVSPLLLASAAVLLLNSPRRPPAHRLVHDIRQTALRTSLLGVTGVYAGFFAGATGTLILLVLLRFSPLDLREANAVKNRVGLVTTLLGLGLLAAPGAPVSWDWLAVAAGPTLAGGALGAALAGRMPINHLRILVVGTAVASALYLLGRLVWS